MWKALSRRLPFPFCLLSSGYCLLPPDSSLLPQLCHPPARNGQENIFKIGFGAMEVDDAYPTMHKVFEQLIKVIGLAAILGVNRLAITSRAFDFRPLGQCFERKRRVAFDRDFDNRVAR